MIRALFVNSGILGQKTFARFIAEHFAVELDGIRAEQAVLTDNLSVVDRLTRQALCARLWPDRPDLPKNLDRLRYRAELNAGLLARKRIRALESLGGPFDVLHFHRQATAYASLDRMRRTPSIVSIDCTQRCVVGASRSALEARSYRPNVRRDGEIFRAARLIVATSQWAASAVRDEYPDCKTEIRVMPNPVQIDAFDPAWIEERHRRASAPSYHPRVLFVGGDFERKGGDVLLAAWRLGGFAARATLDLVTARPPRHVPSAVTVHTGVAAHSPAWRALWRDADIFVMPTRDEAFGIVFQEAAAAGLPSIGTRLNAIPELVLDGETGALVEPGDIEGLCRALESQLASPERRRVQGQNARLHVTRTADPIRYRDALATAIHQVAGR